MEPGSSVVKNAGTASRAGSSSTSNGGRARAVISILRFSITAPCDRCSTIVGFAVERDIVGMRLPLPAVLDCGTRSLASSASTFHGLRHCAASLMLASGADIAVVSKSLGTSRSPSRLTCMGTDQPNCAGRGKWGR